MKHKFPHYWRQSVTIYHKGTSDDAGRSRVTYSRETAEHCFCRKVCRRQLNDKNAEKSDKWILRIPEGESTPIGCGDVIVLGRVNDEADEYTQGLRISDLKAKYADCFTLNSVRDNTGLKAAHYYGSDEE